MSNIKAIFDYKCNENINTDIFPNLITGGATITHNIVESTADMQAPIGGKVVSQTKRYFDFQTSQQQQYLITGILETSGGISGSISRIGSFDDNNDKIPISNEDRGGDGHFFELNGKTLYIVQRRSTNSSPYQEEIRVEQNNWNKDKLNGRGASAFNLDVNEINTFIIKREWSCSNEVSIGVMVNKKIIIAHVFTNNNLIKPYMKRSNLPIRYELDNTNGTATANMKQICSSYSVIGNYNPRLKLFSINSGLVSHPTINVHYITIRLKNNCNRTVINFDKLNYRSPSMSASESILLKILRNPVLGISGTWKSADNNSAIEYLINDDANYTNGGELIYQQLLYRSSLTDLSLLNDRFIFGSLIDGTSDIITILFDETLGSRISYGGCILTWIENL